MSMLFSASTGLFYDPQLHAGIALPADVVRVSPKRHAELLDQQAGGRVITASRDGRPHAFVPRALSLEERRAAVHRAVAAEAARRILVIASLERQSNDNALMAATALTGSDVDARDVQEALTRRLGIDAIRRASNRLDAAVDQMSIRQLAALEVAAATHWPEG